MDRLFHSLNVVNVSVPSSRSDTRTGLLILPLSLLLMGCNQQPASTTAEILSRQTPGNSTNVEAPEQNASTQTDQAAPVPQTTVGEKEHPRAMKFAALDVDHDGILTLAEFSSGRGTKDAEKWFKLRDVDADGVLSRDEFLPYSAPGKGKTPQTD